MSEFDEFFAGDSPEKPTKPDDPEMIEHWKTVVVTDMFARIETMERDMVRQTEVKEALASYLSDIEKLYSRLAPRKYSGPTQSCLREWPKRSGSSKRASTVAGQRRSLSPAARRSLSPEREEPHWKSPGTIQACLRASPPGRGSLSPPRDRRATEKQLHVSQVQSSVSNDVLLDYLDFHPLVTEDELGPKGSFDLAKDDYHVIQAPKFDPSTPAALALMADSPHGPPHSRGSLDALPSNLLVKMMLELNIYELLAVAAVSSKFRRITTSRLVTSTIYTRLVTELAGCKTQMSQLQTLVGATPEHIQSCALDVSKVTVLEMSRLRVPVQPIVDLLAAVLSVLSSPLIHLPKNLSKKKKRHSPPRSSPNKHTPPRPSPSNKHTPPSASLTPTSPHSRRSPQASKSPRSPDEVAPTATQRWWNAAIAEVGKPVDFLKRLYALDATRIPSKNVTYARALLDVDQFTEQVVEDYAACMLPLYRWIRFVLDHYEDLKAAAETARELGRLEAEHEFLLEWVRRRLPARVVKMNTDSIANSYALPSDGHYTSAGGIMHSSRTRGARGTFWGTKRPEIA